MDFKKKIWAYYRKHGRDLPWRRTRDPYCILVSEIMLQQTQVSRVLIKYQEFLKKFPTLGKLAKAQRSEVLKVWQGLGYNRRAVSLHELAKTISRIPDSVEELKKLPGIGPYTAAAMAVFAFDQKMPMIETNIRRVFEHELASPVSDAKILTMLEKTPITREWYYALMDYGSSLPKTFPRPKQSKFEGSNRQLRGALVRLALEHGSKHIRNTISQLEREGLIS